MVWAQEFQRIVVEPGLEIDEGLMVGWFANAMCAATDAMERERKRALDKARARRGGRVVTVRATGAELLILRKLAEGSCRGFSLEDEKTPRGTIYHTLRRLLDKGLIMRQWRFDPPVLWNEITTRGQDLLRDLGPPPSPEEQLTEWGNRYGRAQSRRDDALEEMASCEAEMKRLFEEIEKERADV